MRKLDIDKVQVKYITGINRTLYGYPDHFDVLYDSCMLSLDDKLFSRAKIENTYFSNEKDQEVIDRRIDRIIKTLVDGGFIEKSGSSYKIVKTIWD